MLDRATFPGAPQRCSSPAPGAGGATLSCLRDQVVRRRHGRLRYLSRTEVGCGWPTTRCTAGPASRPIVGRFCTCSGARKGPPLSTRILCACAAPEKKICCAKAEPNVPPPMMMMSNGLAAERRLGVLFLAS